MTTRGVDGADVVYVASAADTAADVADGLAAAGAAVTVVASADAAIRAVRERDPDCVVTEFRLGEGNGLDLLRRLRRERDLPVVVFSDADDPALAAAVLDAAGAFVPTHDGGVDRLCRRLANCLGDEARVGISETMKERAMDEAPVGITVADATQPDEPLVYVNEAFERLTGYSTEQVLGRNCRFLQGPDTDPEAVRELRAGIDGAEPVSVELRNYRRNGEPFWNRVDVAPIRDGSGTVTHYIGFQTDVTRRRRAATAARRWAEECRAERRTVEHVLDRVEGLVEDVTRVLVEASSRRAVERRVCERVAATPGYAAAWVGRVDRTRDEVTTRARAGDVDRSLGDRSVDLSSAAPAARAVRTGTAESGEGSAASPDSDPADCSTIAVPLAYRETTYGVLTVYGADSNAFDAHDATLLASVGRATGNAINAIESKRMVAADEVVAVEVTVSDPNAPLTELAAAAGSRFEFEGVNRRSDGTVVLFLGADGAVSSDVDEDSSVRAITAVSTDPEWSLTEVSLSADTVVGRLGDLGVRLTDLDATDERVAYRFEAPGEPVARSAVDAFEDRYDGVELTRFRRRERSDRSGRGFVRDVRDRLTDRQLTALQKAYFGGFFERPHRVTGDDLADSMGISRSTFHQHLLAAQRKVLGAFLEDRPDLDPIPH
ncbi:bacterio-opsin activator domain-containing protein [Halorussus marinus]|uniref:bacterio-opsin activator domain-containing protein n=1 Tax=Halorussus marinus TaxID=2505976 RepID=UPI00106E73F0|nr:bacterio-opsin activator domain-containing protein [Halorussus marinus]